MYVALKHWLKDIKVKNRMDILIRNNQLLREIDETEVVTLMGSIIKDLGCSDDSELSVLFTTDEEIQRLNFEFRRLNEPTNVLSFPMLGVGPVDAIGDIAVSIPTAVREAREYEITESERLCRLLIHGLLHLLGYDHEVSKEEEDKMFAKEEELMQKYGNRPLLRKDVV